MKGEEAEELKELLDTPEYVTYQRLFAERKLLREALHVLAYDCDNPEFERQTLQEADEI